MTTVVRDVLAFGAVLALGCGTSAPPEVTGADAGMDAAVDAGMDAAPDTTPTDTGSDIGADAEPVDTVLAPGTPLRVGEAGGCNGLRSNCPRTYDRVAIAATHNAFSYAGGGPVHYVEPNQGRPIPDQLNAGIRGLGLRPCPYFGADSSQADRVYVTHNSALRGLLGTEPLDGILTEIKTFLDANPREVVTLYLESTVTPAQIAAVFDQVGLTRSLFVLDRARGWPSLQAMIDAGTRLVVFNDSQDPGRPAWMLYLWDQIVDTDYNVTDPSRFSCGFYRGVAANPVYYLNHFVYQDLGSGVLVPSEANARVVNASDFVLARARRCRAETGRDPAVVYVDWATEGDVVGAVEALNREYAADAGR